MKKLTLTLIIILLSEINFAQSDSLRENKINNKYGLNFALNYTYIVNGLTFGPSISKGRHLFLLGFMIPPMTYIEYYGGNGWYTNCSMLEYKSKKFGVDCKYQIFPNPENKHFRLFFFYDIGMVRYREKGTCRKYYQTSNIDGSGIETIYSVTNSLGYGLKIILFKGLYFSHNIGLGIGLDRRDLKANFPSSPSDNIDYKGNLFSYGNPTLLFNVGLGYDL
jgi:hypothetical protein